MATEDAAHANALAQALVGQHLNQVCVGISQAQLDFSDAGVSLWSPIRAAQAPDALVEAHTLDGLALLLPLLNRDVAAVGVSERGELTLISGDTTLRCGSDPDYESWVYNGPHGEMVVCTPGGDLAVWGESQ